MSNSSTKRLRHPNVMTEAERLALPDPCRPIDMPVRPASMVLDDYLRDETISETQVDTINSFHRRNKNPTQKNAQLHHADIDKGLSCYPTHHLPQLIQEQQQESQHKPCQLRLPLGLVAKMARDGGKDLVETVMKNYPDFIFFEPTHGYQNSHEQQSRDPLLSSQYLKPNTKTPTNAQDATTTKINLEARLYMMGQMYQLMLCVFLLCQCKTRKTLNHQVSLQDLVDAINAYIEAHRIQISFASHQPDLQVDVKHIEFALLAMQWQMSKHEQVGERVTTISANNPLTGC